MAAADYLLCANCEAKVFYDCCLGPDYETANTAGRVQGLCESCHEADYRLVVAKPSTVTASKSELRKRFESIQFELDNSWEGRDTNEAHVAAMVLLTEIMEAEPKTPPNRDQRDGILLFGLVALPYFVDHNNQLRTISVARDEERWRRDGWGIIRKEDEL